MTRTEQKIEPPTEKDYELARLTYAWMESLVDSEKAEKSDYLWNLSVYGKTGVVNAKGLGLVASAITAYQREMNDKAKQSELSHSQHVGQLGKRITSLVTVLTLSPTQYGMCQKLLTDDGNVLTAFGTYLEHAEGEKKGQRVSQGDTLWVRGTVKKHSEFKGVKETILNRPVGCMSPAAAKAEKAVLAKAKREVKKTRDAERKAFGPERVVAEFGFVIQNGDPFAHYRVVQLSKNEFIVDHKFAGTWAERDARDSTYATKEDAEARCHGTKLAAIQSQTLA